MGYPAYAVCFERASYVLHCFRSKSPVRIAKTDGSLIEQRLKAAQVEY